MKKITIIACFTLLSISLFGETLKTVNVSTAGKLNTFVTASEASSITNLTVTGNINAKDMAFIRDYITKLAVLDISTAKFIAYSGTEGTISATSTVYLANELPIYSFYNSTTFTNKTTLTTIKLPTSITSIGEAALCYCSGLSGTFTIPASVKSIGSYALYGCTQITAFSVETANTRYSSSDGILYSKNKDSVFICPTTKASALSIPQTVTYIGPSAYESCSNLTGSLSIPTTVKTIGSYAFYDCSNLTGSISIPSGVIKIEDGTFYGCTGIAGTVTIPKTVTAIGSFAFFECDKISSYTVDALNTKYASSNNALYSKSLDSLFICPSAKVGSFTIPSTVKSIGSYAFYNCSQLTGSLNIPKLVSQIGDYAFYGCLQINAFNVDASNTRYSSKDGVFMNKDQDTLWAYPVGKMGSYSIPTTVKNVGSYSFAYCTNLSGGLTIPSSVSSIGDYAFYGCSGITDINVDSSNKNYASYNGALLNYNKDTLYMCPLGKVGTYQIPTTVTSIDYLAFNSCDKLSKIEIPTSVKSIGNYAFEYCIGLTEIKIPKAIQSIGQAAFYSCSNLNKVSILNSTPPTIDYYCFDLVNKSSCKLYVPIGAKNIYLNTDYWKDFSLLYESDFIDTAVLTTAQNNINIYAAGSSIIIEGLITNEQIQVYTMDGKMFWSGISTSNKVVINAFKQNSYIIRTKNKVVKLHI